MNKTSIVIVVALALVQVVAISVGLKYSQATILFGGLAMIMAPFAIHKTPSVNSAIVMLVILAFFASQPFKRLFQIDVILQELPVTLIYAGVLWLVGMGWKRSWTR